jgi:hypothetical protein
MSMKFAWRIIRVGNSHYTRVNTTLFLQSTNFPHQNLFMTFPNNCDKFVEYAIGQTHNESLLTTEVVMKIITNKRIHNECII